MAMDSSWAGGEGDLGHGLENWRVWGPSRALRHRPLHAELEGFVIPLGFANALSAALVHTAFLPAQGNRVSHHLAKAMPAQPFSKCPQSRTTKTVGVQQQFLSS